MALAPPIGEWSMETVFRSSSPAAQANVDGVARTVFECVPVEQFLSQRWERRRIRKAS
jgi:hypothetical protein